MSKKSNDAEGSKRTCFVIMPISDVEGYPIGHFGEVYRGIIEPAVTAAGYECSLATSTSAAHMIQIDIVSKVINADLCICDLSTRNANVLFEYGLRQAFDRPTVLLKDDITPRIFDLTGFRDLEYSHLLRYEDTLKARGLLEEAIVHTVAASGDPSQVFSLVKLMHLTKAALPSGPIDPQEAKLELVLQKLGQLEEDIAMLRRRPNKLFAGASPVVGVPGLLASNAFDQPFESTPNVGPTILGS